MFGILRFILALNVVIFHLLQVPNIGPLAVYSFFILSGFLMTTIMHKTYGYSKGGIFKYCYNRFLRLFPVYWVLLALTACIIFITGSEYSSSFHSKMQIPTSIEALAANIFLVFPSFNPGEYPVRLAPATWALTIELAFYILIALGISRTKVITNIWLVCSMLYIVYLNITVGSPSFSYGNIFTASLPFSIGASLYFYKDNIIAIVNKFPSSEKLIFTAFILTVVLSGCVKIITFIDDWKITWLCTLANLILSALLICTLSTKKTSNKLLKKLDRELGDLSYPLYVFHWGAGLLSVYLFSFLSLEKLDINNTAPFILSVIITIAVSIVTNQVINKRIDQKREAIKLLNPTST